MASSFFVSQSFVTASNTSETLMASMKAHLTADMLHDGLRGVVFKGMYAGLNSDNVMTLEAVAEVKEYAAKFRAAIEDQGKLELPSEISSALGGLNQPLEEYIVAAERIVAISATGEMLTAHAELPEFDAAFSHLEEAMAGVSDAIELANTTSAERAKNVSSISSLVNYASLGMVITLVGAMLLLSSRLIVQPLRQIATVLGQLANGDLGVSAKSSQPIDELAEIARTVEVFRQNGIKVATSSREEVERAAQAATRAAMMRDFQSAFDDVVGATVEGDFSKRINGTFGDIHIDRISTNFNAMVETVSAGLNEAGHVLAALARTDLTQRMEGNYRGAFSALRDDTNAVANTLTEVVTQLRGTSRALKSATGEILAGTDDLAERTTKQAVAIEETSAAMEQLARTVSENAKKAHDAASRTESAAHLAGEGGQVMEQATLAMERISTSSAKISNIIGLIDDIAFQTNLLALNASVEAARAGEAGKGFAVVAVEVRRLAQSAAQASSEVKALIEQSSHQVSGGTKLVDSASQKLQAISAAVRENSVLMQGISSAGAEQSSSIGEIATAIRQMDEMTQHNAALVEQTNAAIEQTEAQAVELDKIVDVFEIGQGNEQVSQPAALHGRPTTPKLGMRALQDKSAVSRSYLSHGNAAVKQEWSEF
ncbi:MAG: methyl-accepting chemotaxis protein [Devosia sp.]|nr:methyl-accepting chemotaxis protein [Devosia sp.]